MNKLPKPPIHAEHNSGPFQDWYARITTLVNWLYDNIGSGGGGGSPNLDGGHANTIYGGTSPINGGSA